MIRIIQLENEIKIKTDSLNEIRKEIKQLQNQEILSSFQSDDGELTMRATLRMNGKLRKSSNPLSQVISHLNKSDTVKLTDFQEGYWVINNGQYFGYLHELYISDTEEVQIFKEEIERKNEEFRIKKEKEDEEKKMIENNKQTAIQKQKQNEYRQGILNKYGNVTGQKLLDGYYWIGMTSEMAKISLGAPRSINRTVGSWGVHEQWVYYSMYLYFEKGILTSYQDSR